MFQTHTLYISGLIHIQDNGTMNEVKADLKNLKVYFNQIKRQNKLKGGDGVAATEDGKTTYVWDEDHI